MKLRGHLVEGAASSSSGEGGVAAAATLERRGGVSITVAPDARGLSGKTCLLQVGRASSQSAT